MAGPCIVVDFGTAINFDCVSERGEYLGGALVPGIGISADALFSRAARLWRVEIRDPGKIIGTNTAQSLQAGLFYGFTDMVDGIVDAHESRARRRRPSDRHGRTSAADRAGFAAHPADRRIPHARRPAHRLGAQSASAAPAATEKMRRCELPGRPPAKAASKQLTSAAANPWARSTTSTISPRSRSISGGSAARICWFRRSTGPSWRPGRRPASRSTRCLRGIDSAFESYRRSRRAAGRPLKSLAYCVDAVLDAATQKKEAAAGAGPESSGPARLHGAIFARRTARFFSRNARAAGARSAIELSAPACRNWRDASHRRERASANFAPCWIRRGELDLEDLERRLTVLEEQLTRGADRRAPTTKRC